MRTSNAPLHPPDAGHATVGEDDDEALAALADQTIAGDLAAWRALWVKVAPAIRSVTACSRWTGRLCRSADERDVIAVEVMGELEANEFAALRRFRHPEDGAGEGSLLGFVAGVAKRVSVSHVRACPEYVGRLAGNDGASWIELVPIPAEVEETRETEHDPIPAIEAHRLAERLGPRLARAQRAALGAWLDGGDYDEIAREVGLAGEEVARKQVRSALKRLRDRLATEERHCTGGRGESRREKSTGARDGSTGFGGFHSQEGKAPATPAAGPRTIPSPEPRPPHTTPRTKEAPMSDPVQSPGALLAAMKAMREGLDTGLPPGLTQIAAAGKVSAVTEVDTELDGYIKVYQAAEDAELTVSKAVQAREDLAPTAMARYEALRAALKGIFGKKNPDLAKVGLEPDKTPPPATVEQKKAAVAKAQATRKARGTMGPKQKQAIKGEVPPAPPGPAKSGP